MQFFRVVACLLVGVASNAATVAPAGSIRVPVIGYIQLAAGELRPITGFPGANVVAEAISPGPDVRRVFPAPGQRYALLETTEPAQMGAGLLDEKGIGGFTPLAGGLTGADMIAFSPSGQAAILYSGRAQRLQVITGLPDVPRIAADMSTASFEAAVTGWGVSDDATILLAAFIRDDKAFVARIGDNAVLQPVVTTSSVPAIRFAGGTHTAVIADSLANEVFLLAEDPSSPGTLSVRLLAGAAQGVNAPLDIESSTEGTLVFVANSGAGNVLVIDRTTGQVRTLACGFVPSSFQRLKKSVIGVVARDGESVSVLDTDAVTPWVAFAPRVRY